MDQSQQEQLIKMAKNLAPSYVESTRESAQTANKKIDTFASLLVIIGFSATGLSIQLLTRPDLNTEIIKWGLILFIVSILFGFLQLLVDNLYWAKKVEPNRTLATQFTLIASENFNANNLDKIKQALNELEQQPKTSNTLPLWMEVILFVVGGLMIMAELMG